jgi:hypothetical protein
VKRPTNRTLALLAAGAVVIGGGGAAIGVATSGGGETLDAQLADALNKNEGTHLTEADVQQARQDVFKARLDAEVTAGRMTQAQANEMLQRMKDEPHRRAQHESAEAARIAPVAAVLGMTPDALRAEVRGGKTLATLAKEKGVPRAKLLAAIKAGLAAEAKSEGRNPSDARLNAMAARIADGKLGHRGFRGPHRGPDGFGPGGPPPGAGPGMPPFGP